MKKIVLSAIAAMTLSACLGETSGAAVTQNQALSASCASTHMQTMNGLPMRCGPQTVLPYTVR